MNLIMLPLAYLGKLFKDENAKSIYNLLISFFGLIFTIYLIATKNSFEFHFLKTEVTNHYFILFFWLLYSVMGSLKIYKKEIFELDIKDILAMHTIVFGPLYISLILLIYLMHILSSYRSNVYQAINQNGYLMLYTWLFVQLFLNKIEVNFLEELNLVICLLLTYYFIKNSLTKFNFNNILINAAAIFIVIKSVASATSSYAYFILLLIPFLFLIIEYFSYEDLVVSKVSKISFVERLIFKIKITLKGNQSQQKIIYNWENKTIESINGGKVIIPIVENDIRIQAILIIGIINIFVFIILYGLS
jgi:hypothetical protein